MTQVQEKMTQATNKSRRQHSTQIDFTPMVDLGFLLITFFMLTTSLAKPTVMPLIMPFDDGETRAEVPESKVLTLILGADDQVFYYEGFALDSIKSCGYSAADLRNVILEKKKKVAALFPDKAKEKPDGTTRAVAEMQVCIKPLITSRYKNTVDVFDEMSICGLSYYVLLDPSKEERKKIDDVMSLIK